MGAKAVLLALFVSVFSTFSSQNVSAQTSLVTVRGVVLDNQDGGSLPGVVITDADKKNLGITNVNGEFSVRVPAGSSVTFSFIGYTPVTRTFSADQSGVSVRLSASTSALTEVVVTALGIRREQKSLGYATTTVDSTALTQAVSSNWTDALSGKVAGLNLVRNSGPAGSNKIILRGENNLTGDNEALIVIDGVVASSSNRRTAAAANSSPYGTNGDNLPADFGSGLNDLNPEDIESVTVLKGPGAAALYGQRGANGAVIITTKSGNAKKKSMGITFTSNNTWEEINRKPDTQYEYGSGLYGVSYFSHGASEDGASTSGTSSTWGAPFADGGMYYQYDPVTKTRGKERTPWVAYENPVTSFFKTGQETTNSVGLDGTIKKVTLRFSASHGDNAWIVPNTGLERTSLSLSANTKIGKKLSLSAKAIYNNRYSDNLPATGYGNQSLMYWFIFAQPNVNPDWYKDYWAPNMENRAFVNITTTNPESPYAISYEYLNTQRRNGGTGNVQATYNFTKALSLMVRTTLDMNVDNRTTKRPWDAAGSKFAQGSYRVQHINSYERSSDFMLKYDANVRKDLRMTASLGGSLLKNRYNKGEQRADGLIIPAFYDLSNNASPIIYVPDTARYNINSVYGLLSLGYKDYLYLDITGRRDWNSVLASPLRDASVGFTYPSASLAFLASDFWELPKYVSFAKLRASISQVGSGSTTPYRTAYTYQLAASGIYPDNATTNPNILPNLELKPLKTTTYEVGADLRFFKSRLGIDVAYYMGNTKNQILSRIVDRASGYSVAVINAGRVDNQGFEIALNGTPISTKSGFKWMPTMTFSTNRNQIKELADSSVVLRTGALGGGQVVAQVGGSMGDLYGRGYVRNPEGRIVYDANTGYALFTSDVVNLGNTIPKYKASFGNTFSFKQISLSALFDAQMGAVAHSLTFSRMAALGKHTSTLPGRYNGITGIGVIQNADGTYRENDVVATNIQDYYNSVYGSDQAEGSIFSTDFIKFREANLTYAFKPAFAKKLGLNRITLGAFGRNLMIWSPWPAFDPEFGTLAGTDIVTGFETGQLPSTRTFGARLVVGL